MTSDENGGAPQDATARHPFGALARIGYGIGLQTIPFWLCYRLTMRKRLLQLSGLSIACLSLMMSGCSTLTEMVEANLPQRQSGRASIVVSLRAQQASLYRGNTLVAISRISSGREGHRTPIGRFRVLRKDIDHRSSIYGDYVDDSGRIVRANVDIRRDRRPAGSHFLGAPMPFFLEFSPGYGLHQGYLPGEPASHGCIRMPYWKARQFFSVAQVGTPVVVRP